MTCPTCDQDGRSGTVYSDGVWATAAYCAPFYDQDSDRLHHHDGNDQTEQLRCSNGHRWNRERYNTCWCGWTSAPKGATA